MSEPLVACGRFWGVEQEQVGEAHRWRRYCLCLRTRRNFLTLEAGRIAFSDFQQVRCPFCGETHLALKADEALSRNLISAEEASNLDRTDLSLKVGPPSARLPGH